MTIWSSLDAFRGQKKANFPFIKLFICQVNCELSSWLENVEMPMIFFKQLKYISAVIYVINCYCSVQKKTGPDIQHFFYF